MNETEIKIVGVEPTRIRMLLRQHKAKAVKKVFQRTTLYKNSHTSKEKMIVRVREEGKRAMLGVKAHRKIVGNHKIMDEYEIPADAATAHAMLRAMGFKVHEIIELKREYYLLHHCSVELIEPPGFPHYIEIEGKVGDIARVAKLFGYDKKDYDARGIHEIFRYKGNLLFR